MIVTAEILEHAESPDNSSSLAAFATNLRKVITAAGPQAQKHAAAVWHTFQTKGLPWLQRQAWRGLKFSARAGAFGLRKSLIPWAYENTPRRNFLPRATRLRTVTGYVHCGLLGMAAASALIGVAAVAGAGEYVDSRLQAPIVACQAQATAALAAYTGNNRAVNGVAPTPTGRYAELTRLTGVYVRAPASVHDAITNACHESRMRESVPAAVSTGTLPAVRDWLQGLDAQLAKARAAEAARIALSAQVAAQLSEIDAARAANGRRLEAAYRARRNAHLLALQPQPTDDGRVTGCLPAAPASADLSPTTPDGAGVTLTTHKLIPCGS